VTTDTTATWAFLGFVGLTGLAACTTDSASQPGSADNDLTPSPPQLPHLPLGIEDFYDGGCVPGNVPGCTLATLSGEPALTKAKALYDRFFSAGRPKSVAGFGWTPAPWVEAAIRTVRLPALPFGSVDQVRSWISLIPTTPRFERTDGRSNLEIFEELSVLSPELLRDRQSRPYELYNARDFVPAALTHYQAPTPVSDIMATNFVYRIVKQPWRMEGALADCTKDPVVPCIDAIAALSSVDIASVVDVRFIRWEEGSPMVSRLYRAVVVDCGHQVQRQATLGPNEAGSPHIPTNHGAGPELLWRAEIGGSLATLLETGPGAAGALLAYSSVSGEGGGITPPRGACTDLNDGSWKCGADTQGIDKTWKCTHRQWMAAGWGCRIPAGVPIEPE
jgi:hypothetical protein